MGVSANPRITKSKNQSKTKHSIKLFPNAGIEIKYLSVGKSVVGIDEVGRGSLAGPVVSAALLITPHNLEVLKILAGVHDSKLLTVKQRINLYKLLTKTYVSAIGQASCKEIDRFGIRYATYLSMMRAYKKISKQHQPDYVLIDGKKAVIKFPFTNVFYYTRGDSRVYSIAAASVIAKVYRDKLLTKLHKQYPVYNWKNNKGYATLEHKAAIKEFGQSPYHRRTFLTKIFNSDKSSKQPTKRKYK